MQCINTKSKEFQELLEASKLPSLLLEMKISQFQDKNGLESYPKLEDVVKSNDFEEKFIKNTKKKVKKSLLEFVNYLEEKPTISFIKKDYSSEHSRILFNNKQGKITVDEILENILNNFNDLSPKGKELIEKSRRLIGRNGAKFQFVSDEQLTSRKTLMQIKSDTNTIQISRNRIKNTNSREVVESFIHEIAHAQSIKALKNPETFEEKEFKKFIDSSYYKFWNKQFFNKSKDNKKYSNENESYGFKNELEFVAEIYANPIFRQELKNLDIENKTNFWEDFINYLRRLIGLSKNKESNKLIETIVDFVEADRRDYQGLKGSTLIFQKQEAPKDIKLDTLDKQLQHTINLSKDRIIQLLARTKSNKNIKNKEDHKTFIASFETLLDEIKSLESTDKWKSITSYVTSFQKTIFSINKGLDALLYDEASDSFTKDIDSNEMLESINRYNEYLNAYDLLEEINTLIGRSENSKEVNSVNREQIEDIKDILTGLQKQHNKIESTFLNVRRAYAVKEFSKPENNTKTVTEWRNKLYAEHAKLNIKNETKQAYFGRMIEGKYKDDYNQALENEARKIVYDPSFDISQGVRMMTDVLNTNSSLLNIMSNIIGKMRDKILSAYHDKQFELDKIYKKYSKEKGQNKQSAMYKNLVQLSKNDKYYLKGEYSIDFLNTVENDLRPILNSIKEIKDSHNNVKKDYKVDEKYIKLEKSRKEWFRNHTIKEDLITKPDPKYLNTKLTGVEKEALDYFIKETETNNKDNYKGQSSLINNLYGAKFYSIPGVTKSDLERTLEGDLKGQAKDKWTDLTNIKVDDVGFAEAIDSKNKELRTVRVHYRGNIKSKDQSLDLFTVYRKEALNAINYGEKKTNELKLKLFVDIASSKDYKRRSNITSKWAQNKYAENVKGSTFSGEHAEELKRIEGLLETHLYDVLSYSGGKVLGSNVEVTKLSSMFNGFAASIAMTANLGSGVVNVLNGVTQMFIDSVGGTMFNKSDLLKAEANYTKNIMNIMADLNQPTKKAFHNQLLDMFDIIGGFDNATQEFIRNSLSKKLISKQSMNGLNEMGEHMMNSILTEAVLRGLKVMNAKREFIDKNGNVVSEEKAASLFDMLSLNEDGKLVMSDKVVYTNKNLDTEYHKGGKQHINYTIKKKGHDIFGVYDPLMKAEIAKHWWGKTLMMFKNFFLGGLQYRYKGIQTSLKNKSELTDEDITFNNAEQEFTEGIYTTFARFISQAVIPALKGLQLSYTTDYYNSLSDYEKANIKKTTLEIGLTMVILPVLGMLLAAAAGDDDDELFFAMYAFRRLESELSQFRDPRELNRMIQNPVAANRFIQNSLTFASDLLTPLNFNPTGNAEFFDYLSEDAQHKNIMLKHAKKITPFYAQTDKEYKRLYSLIDK